MARRDVRQIVAARLKQWLQGLAGWLDRWASRARDSGRAGADGTDAADRTEELIPQPGGPPAHWVEQLGHSGPPAHWLQWIREQTSGDPDAELPESLHVSAPHPAWPNRGFRAHGAGQRPAGINAPLDGARGPADEESAPGQVEPAAARIEQNRPPSAHPSPGHGPGQAPSTPRAKTAWAPSATAGARTVSGGTWRAASELKPEEVGKDSADLPADRGRRDGPRPGPLQPDAASRPETEMRSLADKDAPVPDVSFWTPAGGQEDRGASLGRGDQPQVSQPTATPGEHSDPSAERLSLPGRAGPETGVQPRAAMHTPPPGTRSFVPASTGRSLRWASLEHTERPKEEPSPGWGLSDQRSWTGAVDGPPEWDVDRWPSLPDERRAGDEDATITDWEGRMRTWQRLQRLDREQRGILWNELPF